MVAVRGRPTDYGLQTAGSASRTVRQASRLELHIGELVLQGFPGMDPELLGAAVQAELSRLFAEEGLPARLEQGGAVASLDAGQFTGEDGEDVRRLGARIARAVYGGLQDGGLQG